MKLTHIEKVSIFSIFVFVVLAIFAKGSEPSGIIIALLSVSTFLFGIFGAFVMQDRYSRLNELKSILRKDDSLYINIYKMSSVFGRAAQKKIQGLIDNYITKTIDLKLEDYHEANKEFLSLFTFIVGIKPKTSRQIETYGKLLDCINHANENRSSMGHLVRNRIERFEWLSLTGLLASIIFIVFYMNDNSLTSIIISVLISAASVMLLLIIKDLDSLRWKEQKWIWDPLKDLFNDLDLLPYYPDYNLMEKRIVLSKGTKVRIAHYPNPYPDFRGKKIEIRTT